MIFFFKIVGGQHQMTFGVKFSIVSRLYTFKIDISKIGITEKNPKDFIVFFLCSFGLFTTYRHALFPPHIWRDDVVYFSYIPGKKWMNENKTWEGKNLNLYLIIL